MTFNSLPTELSMYITETTSALANKSKLRTPRQLPQTQKE